MRKQVWIKIVVVLMLVVQALPYINVQAETIDSSIAYEVEQNKMSTEATITFRGTKDTITITKITDEQNQVVSEDQTHVVVHKNGTYVYSVEYQEANTEGFKVDDIEVVIDQLKEITFQSKPDTSDALKQKDEASKEEEAPQEFSSQDADILAEGYANSIGGVFNFQQRNDMNLLRDDISTFEDVNVDMQNAFTIYGMSSLSDSANYAYDGDNFIEVLPYQITLGNSTHSMSSKRDRQSMILDSNFTVDFTRSFMIEGTVSVKDYAIGYGLALGFHKPSRLNLTYQMAGGGLGIYHFKTPSTGLKNAILMEVDFVKSKEAFFQDASFRGPHVALMSAGPLGNLSLITGSDFSISDNLIKPIEIQYDHSTDVLTFTYGSKTGTPYEFTYHNPKQILGNQASLFLGGSVQEPIASNQSNNFMIFNVKSIKYSDMKPSNTIHANIVRKDGTVVEYVQDDVTTYPGPGEVVRVTHEVFNQDHTEAEINIPIRFQSYLGETPMLPSTLTVQTPTGSSNISPTMFNDEVDPVTDLKRVYNFALPANKGAVKFVYEITIPEDHQGDQTLVLGNLLGEEGMDQYPAQLELKVVGKPTITIANKKTFLKCEQEGNISNHVIYEGVSVKLHDGTVTDFESFHGKKETRIAALDNLSTSLESIPANKTGGYRVDYTFEDEALQLKQTASKFIYVSDKYIENENLILIGNDISLTTSELYDRKNYESTGKMGWLLFDPIHPNYRKSSDARLFTSKGEAIGRFDVHVLDNSGLAYDSNEGIYPIVLQGVYNGNTINLEVSLDLKKDVDTIENDVQIQPLFTPYIHRKNGGIVSYDKNNPSTYPKSGDRVSMRYKVYNAIDAPRINWSFQADLRITNGGISFKPDELTLNSVLVKEDIYNSSLVYHDTTLNANSGSSIIGVTMTVPESNGNSISFTLRGKGANSGIHTQLICLSGGDRLSVVLERGDITIERSNGTSIAYDEGDPSTYPQAGDIVATTHRFYNRESVPYDRVWVYGIPTLTLAGKKIRPLTANISSTYGLSRGIPYEVINTEGMASIYVDKNSAECLMTLRIAIPSDFVGEHVLNYKIRGENEEVSEMIHVGKPKEVTESSRVDFSRTAIYVTRDDKSVVLYDKNDESTYPYPGDTLTQVYTFKNQVNQEAVDWSFGVPVICVGPFDLTPSKLTLTGGGLTYEDVKEKNIYNSSEMYKTQLPEYWKERVLTMETLIPDSIVDEAFFISVIQGENQNDRISEVIKVAKPKSELLPEISTSIMVKRDSGSFEATNMQNDQLKNYIMPNDTLQVTHKITGHNKDSQIVTQARVTISKLLLGGESFVPDAATLYTYSDNPYQQTKFGDQDFFTGTTYNLDIPSNGSVYLTYQIKVPYSYDKQGDLKITIDVRDTQIFRSESSGLVAGKPTIVIPDEITLSSTNSSRMLTMNDVIKQLEFKKYDDNSTKTLNEESFNKIGTLTYRSSNGSQAEITKIDQHDLGGYILRLTVWDDRNKEYLSKTKDIRLWVSDKQYVDEINQIKIMYHDVTMSEDELRSYTDATLSEVLKTYTDVKAYHIPTMTQIDNVVVDPFLLKVSSPPGTYSIGFISNYGGIPSITSGTVIIDPSVLGYVKVPNHIELMDGAGKVVENGTNVSKHYVGSMLGFTFEGSDEVLSSYEFAIDTKESVSLQSSKGASEITAQFYDHSGAKLISNSDDEKCQLALLNSQQKESYVYVNVNKQTIKEKDKYEGTIVLSISSTKHK